MLEGSIETARQCMNTIQAEDRRDLIAQEIDRYDTYKDSSFARDQMV